VTGLSYAVNGSSYLTNHKVRSALFWDLTQRKMVVTYRSFGATFRSHFQRSSSLGLLDPHTV